MKVSIVLFALAAGAALAFPVRAGDAGKPVAISAPARAHPLVVKPAAVRHHAPQADAAQPPRLPRSRHEMAVQVIRNVR